MGSFGLLYLLEKKRPLRREIEPKPINTLRNLAIATTAGAAVYLLEKPITRKLTRLVEGNDLGLLKKLDLPDWAETAAAVVLLDYTLYLWHVLTHKAPFLWRFHRVHHADLDLTASTAIRFHFGEMAISVLFRAGQIILIGVSPKALSIWQKLLLLSIVFHHSNIRLPKDFEEKLELLIMTPRLHGIHHSSRLEEMDSNWSSGLSLWDLLHGTFRQDVRQERIVIGVPDLDRPDQVTLGKMLTAPFSAEEKPEMLED